MDLLNTFSASPLWLFALLVLGVIVLPGLDMAYVLASALAGGRRAAAAALAGIVAGGVAHVALAALGVGLVLRLQPAAFNAMLAVSALYMAWIGWSLWRGAGALGEVRPGAPTGRWRLFRRGAITCLSNPKAYLFMLAVFPPFVQVAPAALPGRLLALAAIIAVTQLLVYGAIGWGAGSLQPWLRRNPATQVRVGRAVGALLVLAALWTGWQGWR
jgi:threonine/homoserine/homoserine lactone efflux protein